MVNVGKKLVAEERYIKQLGYSGEGWYCKWLKDFHDGKVRCFRGHWSRFDPEKRKPTCYGDR